MGALRQSRSQHTDMGSSSGFSGISGGNQPSGTFVPSVSQGLPTLIVMIVVLFIIVLFCFWGAPAVRAFCKRKICCCCPMDEPNLDNGSTGDGSATPTIILLPYGRMLVVDRTVFAQLQADHTGIDFMELSANLIRAQRLQTGSNPSILESEATSKGLSPTSLDFLPPAYEDIFGAKNSDLPPSYSEISMMFRNMSVESVSERVPHEHIVVNNYNSDNNNRSNNRDVSERRRPTNIIANNNSNNIRFFNASALRTSSSAPFVFKEEDGEFTTSQLKEFKHGFSSLENNIERSDPENDQRTNNKRRNAENNGLEEAEEICSGSGFNQNANNKHVVYMGPKNENCSSPADDEAKIELVNEGNNQLPCNSVQYLQSCSSNSNNQGHISGSNGKCEEVIEYIDKESSV